MRKLIALLLAAVMVFGLVACSNTPSNTTKPDDSTTTPSTDNQSAETPDDTSDETPADDTTETPETPATPVENKIVYGSTTELGGDFAYGMWTNGATDLMVSKMMNDYLTVTTNQYGEYIENPTVLKSYETTENEDGSKTFTMTINEGLVYNNGDPITAKDYVARILFTCSSVASQLEANVSGWTQISGGKEYYDGEASTVTGVRLLDEYTFSVTILPDYLPYFYDILYAAYQPWNLAFWFGPDVDVVDDGEGAYFTLGGDAAAFTADAVRDYVLAARNPSGEECVSAGPYMLKSFDKSAKEATLVINPNYAGNFEGQKPSIETIVVTLAEDETWADAITTGQFNFYDTITDGDAINTALDIIENQGGFDYIQFDRAGYGKIQFVCDFGPTQFVEVRHAVAMLLDRKSFAETFCKGWGDTVDGPYGVAMWQYQESKELFADTLDSYSYNVEKANQVLDEGGWTLTADGSEWTTGAGVRYKEVTAEEAANYESYCVTVDGKLLMPLQIQWASSENNPVSDLIATMLVNGSATIESGVQINQATMDFSTLLGWLYRQDVYGVGGDFTTPTYGMFNLATGFTSTAYDQSYEWTDDETYLSNGYNLCRLFDMGEGGLDELSMDMVFGIEAGDDATYLDMWQKYIIRWNELLPELPLYSNIYITMYPDYLEGYEQNAYWSFESAILYASIPSAQ